MRTKQRLRLFLPVLPVIFAISCTRDNYLPVNPEKEVFKFIVTNEQEQIINTSRGIQYEVTDPLPELDFAGETYTVDRFEIRGEGTLNFARKGFSVNLGRRINLYNSDEQTERKYEEFKLLAMVFDFTYIENSVAVRFFKEIDLWPVLSFFTEVKLNDHTQGLYHFVEDPFEYFIEQENSPFVIRRGYDHVIKAYSSGPANMNDPRKYTDRFKKIYSDIALYSGQQLYDTLSATLDLDQYFTKLSMDFLLRNGDYTDEVIFYSKVQEGKEIFGIFPWDFDDIFAPEPHEIGNSWATGTVFGTREYNSMDDVITDVGQKLLYSIEDDLDYKIAKDNVLYQEYLKRLRRVIENTGPSVIDRIFDYTLEHIGPFYSNDLIISQSVYDADETNYELFMSNLEQKRQLVKDRRNWILTEFDKQQN